MFLTPPRPAYPRVGWVRWGSSNDSNLCRFFFPFFPVFFFFFSPPSRTGHSKIWDLREGRLAYTFNGHSGSVRACAFSPDGTRFASGGRDGVVVSWRSHLATKFVGVGECSGASKEATVPKGAFDVSGEGNGHGRLDNGAGRGVREEGGRRRTALGVRMTNSR